MKQVDPANPHTFTLGNWTVEPDRNRLSCNGRATTIENKSMDVLVLLASRPGDVLSNDDIIDAVWDGRPMGENPVYKCIANLRNALGDDSRAPEFIETISRKGYRLIAEVSSVSLEPMRLAKAERASRSRPILLAVGLSITALTAFVLLRQEVPELAITAPSNSIAVMPFENLSADSENDFFCHGIADELLNRLAEMPGLRVIARRSSFSMGEHVEDITEFAKSLGVRYVLSGSVRQSGDLFRVNARLLDRSGALIWSDTYDRHPDDMIDLQDDVANAVAKGLAIDAGDAFLTRPVRTENFDAYSSYLIGRELQKRRPLDWGPTAIAAFEEAIRLDPNFAEPYAGLATASLLTIRESPASMRVADQAIDTALQINPNLAQGHAAAGLSAMFKGSGSDYRRAEASLRRAIQLNPSLVEARGWLSTVLTVQGQEPEALRILHEAISLDPLNPILSMNLGRRYHADGRLDMAREQMVKALQLPDIAPYAWFWVAEIDNDAGKLDVALDWSKQAVRDGVFDDDARRWYAGGVAAHYAGLMMFNKANRWAAASLLPASSHWRLKAEYDVFVGQTDTTRFDEELLAYEATLSAENPMTLMSRSIIGRYAIRSGDYERGIRVLEPIFSEGWALHNAPGGSHYMITTLHFLAVALQRTGQAEKARVLLEKVLKTQLATRSGRTKMLGQLLAREAITYLLLGEKELALTRFEEAVAGNWRYYTLIPGNPCWDGFKGDPRFESVLAEVKRDIDLQRERVLAAERIRPFEPPES